MMSVIKVIGMFVLLSFVGGCDQRSYSAEFEKARTSMRDAGIPEETITRKMQEIEITVGALKQADAPSEDIVKTIQDGPKSAIAMDKMMKAQAEDQARDAAQKAKWAEDAKHMKRFSPKF